MDKILGEKYDGQKSVTDLLYAQLAKNKPFHAYLFHGPGKKIKFTLRFAKAILCTNSNRPCAKCPSCRMFKLNIHPNFIEIKREEEKTEISIEVVKTMIHRVSLKAQGGRVVLIKGAHLLSHEAVNAMLKTIEESSTGTIFIFTTRNKSGIMPTIISRCQGYYFPEKDFSVHENQALEFLQSDLIHRFDFVKKISNSRLKAAKFLDDLQRYLRNQLRNNNSLRKTEIARGIRLAGHSQDLLKMNVSAKLILENLSLKIKKRRLENN